MISVERSAVGLLGAGGQAREVVSYLRPSSLAFIAVTQPHVAKVSGFAGTRVIDLDAADDCDLDFSVVAAVGAPGLRRELVSRWRGGAYATVVARAASVSTDAKLGDGSIVAPGAVVTAGVSLGQHVLVNAGATVAHDSRIGDYSSISPGAHIAGRCDLGPGCFVGIGAVVSNDVTVGEGAVIGAGATVVSNVGANEVWVGVPARRLRLREGWLHDL